MHIYSVDTSAFYYEDENKIHKTLNTMYILRSKVRKRRKKINKKYTKDKEKYQLDKKYIDILYARVNKVIKKAKSRLYKLFDKNKNNIRELNESHMVDKNVVSIFDSTLTRVTGMEINELSEDLVIVQAYFFQVLEDIILNGFTYKGEKYIVYTASAGQIRTKKTVFIKEKILRKYENTLTCGLTDRIINSRGTININKYLAYRALQNSATDEWIDFDIDKSVVVNDFETNVETEVDYINDKTYEIERVNMEVPIPHTDGCGMMLPSFCNKSRMCRAPWVKGLLVPFDFKKFVLEKIEKTHINHAVIKDIYGKEYDIIKDDIQVIFTESQFKMHKFYNSWQEYKDNFKKYNCQAGYCNEEESYIKDARINYQMLQTLSDMKNKEIKSIAKRTTDDIYKISNDKDTMMKLLGVTKHNTNKNNFQKAVQYYPQLLNDSYSKNILNQVKRSLVKKAKSGKLEIKAKYSFICPDLYAFSEWLFLGDKNPRGLLKKDEVSCNLYHNNQELDCLRSPHLYMEHCVRTNRVKEKQKEWFVTKGIYTSCRDIISKILQFDVDGDKSLVCSDKKIVKIAKRNIKKKDIVPLYYDMKKAGSMHVDNETIYEGLTSAYKGGNIGAISNDITKIWNSENIDLEAIKLLCMENNFVIDYAKTLYKPERPKEKKEKITQHTRKKVPYFFLYAKDKPVTKVEPLNNSVVNKLNKIVKNPNLKIENVCGRFNYKKLMRNNKIEINEENQYIIDKYNELDIRNIFMLEKQDKRHKMDNLHYQYKKIRDEMLTLNEDIYYVVDVLVKYLYNVKKDDKKVTLWESFGDIVVENIKENLTKNFKHPAIECQECGCLIEKKSGRTKYCNKCWKEKRKKDINENAKKYYKTQNN